MYNHYIPGTNGVYHRKVISEEEPKCAELPQQQNTPIPCEPLQTTPQRNYGSNQPDIGDLLLICIVLLLALDSEKEDILPVLVTAAAFLFGL